MNRPSRTDDDFDHPTWNQQPPFLAADLTTCQDLNGIANMRMQRKGSGPGEGTASALLDEKMGSLYYFDPEEDSFRQISQEDLKKAASNATIQQARRTPSLLTYDGSVWSWTLWVASVIVTSLLLSAVTRLLLPHRGHPIEFKRRPIHLKRDTCANSAVGTEAEYDIPLHVGALLIILFVSGFACAFPLIAKKFPRLRIPKTVFFLARHFGTGVLVATAFVHLLPTAFISLGDPCLSGFFTQDYPPMPGAIALAGIFFVTIIEMVFHPARQIYESNPPDTNSLSGNERSSAGMLAGSPDDRREADNDRDSMSGVSDLGPLHGRNDSVSRQLSRLDQGGDIAPAEGDPPLGRTGKTEADTGAANADVERSSHDLRLTPEQLHRKQILQCMLLEMGILFHSVFIGMALSVSVGTNFIVLLVAISFHQTFEGLALGARIAAIEWPEDTYQPWLMALAYGCTTPIGQAIGLSTHMLYNPQSAFGLVLVGTMNAISSGLLVFASLIELLSEDLLSDESWRILRGKKRVWACVLVFLGAFCMSLVGAWA